MKEKLTKAELIWIASKAVSKRYSFDDVKYGDDLYGNEDQAYEVFEYMEEMEDIGRIAFYEKYKEFKLY